MDRLNRRGIPAVVLAILALIVIYGWVIAESYAQLPQNTPQYANPSPPYPYIYETVAASQTAQVLGTVGAKGDYLAGCLVIPATTSPGSVTVLDNATAIVIFTGGATSVTNLVPFFIQIGAASASGPWKVTTATLVSVVCIGKFT